MLQATEQQSGPGGLSPSTTIFAFEYDTRVEDEVVMLSPDSARSRWARRIDIILGIASAVYACLQLYVHGPGFSFWLFLGLFAVLFFHNLFFQIFARCLYSFHHPTIAVSITDHDITTKRVHPKGEKKLTQTIPWSSFSHYGIAVEFPNHFLLTCGRGAVWIPKRVFSGDEETAFRSFVVDKMGERSQTTTPFLYWR
jgi:hypothetical protein